MSIIESDIFWKVSIIMRSHQFPTPWRLTTSTLTTRIFVFQMDALVRWEKDKSQYVVARHLLKVIGGGGW